MTMRKNKTIAPELPQLLTEEEAARYMGVTRSYLRKVRCSGKSLVKGSTPPPTFTKVGERIMYPRMDCDSWVANLPRQQVIG